MHFKKHVFVCTNQRADGRKCCGDVDGMALVTEFKRLMKEQGLTVNMRAQKTGCFDLCAFGPTVMVYPEGTIYGGVQLADVAEIVESDLKQNKLVERLVVEVPKVA